jgi:hypothetical protein
MIKINITFGKSNHFWLKRDRLIEKNTANLIT